MLDLVTADDDNPRLGGGVVVVAGRDAVLPGARNRNS